MKLMLRILTLPFMVFFWIGEGLTWLVVSLIEAIARVWE